MEVVGAPVAAVLVAAAAAVVVVGVRDEQVDVREARGVVDGDAGVGLVGWW